MTVAQYDRLTELGWFGERRVELINGRIIRMPAQLEPHVAGVNRAARAMLSVFGEGYYVRFAAPLVQGKFSKPEPDVAVVLGTEEEYLAGGAPRTGLLVIEVSDSTLRQEQGRKASLYAQHGIQQYWIINLIERQLEIHRDPVCQPGRPVRFNFGSIQILKPPTSVSPLAAPHANIAVASLIP